MFSVYGAAWKLTPAIADEDFSMEMHAFPLGDLMLANASLSQTRIQQDSRRGSSASNYTYSIYVVDRRQQIAMGDTRAILEAGDFTLFDNRRASSIVTSEPYTTIALTMPADYLHQYLPDPEPAVGLRLSGSEGLTGAAAGMLHSFWGLAESGQLVDVGNRLSRNFLEIFATCVLVNSGVACDDTAVARDLKKRIKAYIDEHLRDPDLSTDRIAHHFGLSTRTVQTLFAGDNETVSAYVRHQRLEGCRHQLIDPLWRRRGITEVAFGWGFNDATHFARLFRERYGMSAREYRNSAAGS